MSTQQISHGTRLRPLTTIVEVMNTVANGIASVAGAYTRSVKAAREFEQLSKLSADQLKSMDLSRETIPAHISARYLSF